MTLLIISHMRDVTLHLVKNNPYISKIYLANVSLADRLYYGYLFKKHGIAYENIEYKRFSKDERRVVYPLVESLLKESIEYLRLHPEQDFSRIIDHYSDLFLNFRDFFTDHTVDATCTWNGQRVFDLIINHHAREHGCSTLFYEMGLFRPDTTTIDAKGVNVRNSVPREISFYKQYDACGSINVPAKTDQPLSSNTLYTAYKLFDHLLALLGLSTYKRFDNLYRPKLSAPSTAQTVTLEHLDPTYINIFCPLQVSHDTQVLLNSPYIKSMEAFFTLIKECASEFANMQKKVRFYLKAHPKEMQPIAFDFTEAVFAFDPDISSADAVKATDLTLTINSTVGLEAVQYNKPCVTLAETFYSTEPIAFFAHPGQVPETIEKALKESDPDLQNRLINYLRHEYQLPYNPFTILAYESQPHHQKFMELVNEK